MSSRAKFIVIGVLGWLLLCAAAYSEELTEEDIDSITAKDGGRLALVKTINSMPQAERVHAIRLVLTLIERNIGRPRPEHDLPKFIDLLPILPMLGMPDEVAASLAPMINCENSRIRPDVFHALAELQNDVGLDIVLTRMDYLFSRLPDIDAPVAGEGDRQRNADTVAFVYSMKGLLQARSDEKRKLGFGFLDRLRKKYADTERGRELFSEFVGEFRRLGVSLDSPDLLGVNVLKANPTRPVTHSGKPMGDADLGQTSEAPVGRTTEPQSFVRCPFVLVAVMAIGILALVLGIAQALRRRA